MKWGNPSGIIPFSVSLVSVNGCVSEGRDAQQFCFPTPPRAAFASTCPATFIRYWASTDAFQQEPSPNSGRKA